MIPGPHFNSPAVYNRKMFEMLPGLTTPTELRKTPTRHGYNSAFNYQKSPIDIISMNVKLLRRIERPSVHSPAFGDPPSRTPSGRLGFFYTSFLRDQQMKIAFLPQTQDDAVVDNMRRRQAEINVPDSLVIDIDSTLLDQPPRLALGFYQRC